VNLVAMRVVAVVDAANVVALGILSPRHGLAAAAGYAPALCGTLLVHRSRSHRRLARALCVAGLVPNTALSAAAAGGGPRARTLSWYVGVGGAVLGIGYLLSLRR
jgi:hypothetical protein